MNFNKLESPNDKSGQNVEGKFKSKKKDRIGYFVLEL